MAAATSIILAGVAVAGATATAVGQAKAAKAKEEQARQNAAEKSSLKPDGGAAIAISATQANTPNLVTDSGTFVLP